MKKLVLILAAIAAVTLLATSCKRNERRAANALEEVCSSIDSLNVNVKDIGENTENMSESLEDISGSLKGIDGKLKNMQPLQRPKPKGCMSISWNTTEEAWNELPISKAEVENLASHTTFGDYFTLEKGDSIVNVLATITVYQIHSDSPIQTIVFYEFKPSLSNDEVTSMALIQGAYSSKDFDNIKLVVNTQTNCCSQKMPDCIAIRFGGRFCKEPQCVKKIHRKCTQKTSDCIPCQSDKPTIGIKYDDLDYDDPDKVGVLNVPNGSNARIIQRRQ